MSYKREMNRVAVFHMLALFCLPFALAQPEPKYEILEQIEKAYVERVNALDGWPTTSRTFDEGDVYLYKLVYEEERKSQEYVVGDSSGGYSDKFTMGEHDATVTEDKIAIKSFPLTIIMTFHGIGNTFKIYQKLFTLDNFSRHYSVKQVFHGKNPLDKVSAIKAKQVQYYHWLFVFMDNDTNTPHLIFPQRCLKSISMNKNTKEVLVVLEMPCETPTTVVFVHSADATAFFDLVKPLIPKPAKK